MNPRANADQPGPDAGMPRPEQGGWPNPSGFEGYPPPPPGYPQGGFPPPSPAGYPPPPPAGGYPPPPPAGGFPPSPPSGYPPPGYGPPTDYPGFGTPPGYPPGGYGAPPGYPPGGYGAPPGYPPGGYGTPYPGGYFNPGQPQKTNVLAVSSLLVALLGLLFWPLAILGTTLGVIALGQIKRTGEPGHGLAVAGVAVGGAAVVLSFILAMVALH